MTKLKAVPPNAIDKAVAFFAPRWAVQRHAARQALALSGAYTGARVDRAATARWLPTAGSANADTASDLALLRSRSRDQMRNSPVALGALNSDVSHVVGTGLAMVPAIDATTLGLTEQQAEAWQDDTERRFRVWAESTWCDHDRHLNLYGLQALVRRSWRESGDCFVVTPLMPVAGRVQLRLQVIEADRVCNPNKSQNTDSLIEGVALDAAGVPRGVHIARNHPGDYAANNTWAYVDFYGAQSGRRNVLQLWTKLRPGQVRGVPWVAPILEPLKQLVDWSNAELRAAVVSSLYAVFLKMDPEAFQTLFEPDDQKSIVTNASKWSGDIEDGQVINLLPGEEPVTHTPGRPNPEFDPFWQACVRQIGMALGVPLEVLTMHFQSSYTAARGALLMAWKTFRAEREQIDQQFNRPVYELWLSNEVAQGRIRAPGFFADPMVRAAWCGSIWTGDGPGSVDPEKEVRAAKERVEMTISTLDAESRLHDGVPWKVKHAQRLREVAAQRQAGIYYPPAGTPATTPGATPGATPRAGPDGQGGPDDADDADKQGPSAPGRAPDGGNPPPTRPNRAAAEDADSQGSAQASQQTAAMFQLAGAVAAMAARPAGDTHIHAAPVQVDNHLPAPQVLVTNQVHSPDVHAHFEATLPSPEVQVNLEAVLPPAQVVVNHPAVAEQTIQRDADGEVLKTTTVYTSAKP